MYIVPSALTDFEEGSIKDRRSDLEEMSEELWGNVSVAEGK